MAKGEIRFKRPSYRGTRKLKFDTENPDTVFTAMTELLGGDIEVMGVTRHLSEEEQREQLLPEWRVAVTAGETEEGFEEWVKNRTGIPLKMNEPPDAEV